MTTTEAAAIAGVTPTTIRRWIAIDRLVAGTSLPPGPPWKLVWDITPEALAVAIAAQRRPGRPYKNPQPPTPEAQEAEGVTP